MGLVLRAAYSLLTWVWGSPPLWGRRGYLLFGSLLFVPRRLPSLRMAAARGGSGERAKDGVGAESGFSHLVLLPHSPYLPRLLGPISESGSSPPPPQITLKVRSTPVPP